MLISAGEIISRSIELYKKNAGLFLTYSLLFLIPSLGIVGSANFFAPEVLAENYLAADPKGLLIHVALSVALSFVTVWFSIAFFRVLTLRYQEKEVGGLAEELTRAKKYIIPVFLVSLLTALVVFIGVLLFIIPGIIFAVWYAFAFYEIIFEDKKIMEAMKESKRLVEGRWWSVFWRLLAPLLVFIIAMQLITWALTIPLVALSSPVTKVLFQSIGIIVGTLFFPLTNAPICILYLELKKTKEEPRVSVEMLAPKI